MPDWATGVIIAAVCLVALIVFFIVTSLDYGSLDEEKLADAKRQQAEQALAERELRLQAAERLADIERREAALRRRTRSQPAGGLCLQRGGSLRPGAAFCTRCGAPAGR